MPCHESELGLFESVKEVQKEKSVLGANYKAVYNHWTGLVDWTAGLTLKIIFTLSNETHPPVGLHDA